MLPSADRPVGQAIAVAVEPLSPEAVARKLRANETRVSDDQAHKLTQFLNLLEQWNRVHNLTGIHDRDELVERHLVESLAIGPFVLSPAAADVGSGGGLPGMPLAICHPDVAFTLIESRRKRVSFLRHVKAGLGLGNVTVEHSRAEDVAAGPFATVLARAVAPPAELLAVTGPLLAPGGRLVLLTGESKGREIVRLASGFRQIDTDQPIGVPALPDQRITRSRIVVLEREPVS